MIEPINGHGVNRANVFCDICQRHETVTCDYERQHQGEAGTPNYGQITRKMAGKGWATVKKVMRCPACEAKRKASNAKTTWLKEAEKIHTTEAKMAEKSATVTDLRSPTPAQRREIHQHLLSFYDVNAGRYQDKATDKTIAGMIGGGCMPGWVAEIREADYGPDGGNAEIDAILAEIEAMRKDMGGKIDALQKRIDAVKLAVGPRAVKA